MKELHAWFFQNQREFPWRENRTPYTVWISEVMLQQTRASAVIPYFERWLALFPGVEALAAAPLERVIKAWEGLGYYSRARNLHRGAQQIVERFDGQIPSQRQDLESIHGLGSYTVAAILSFAFRQKCAAIDANVTRVIARYASIEENVCKQSGKKKIAAAAEALLDDQEPWVTAEALIELGATVCSAQKPQCSLCPLQKTCLGKQKAASLPVKNEKQQTIQLHRAVILLEADGKILVKKGEEGKVMADLYEFPYFEMGKERWTLRDTVHAAQRHFGFNVEFLKKLPPVSHTFTRFKAHLYPIRCKTEEAKPIEGYQWVLPALLFELPFSSGHRRIFSS